MYAWLAVIIILYHLEANDFGLLFGRWWSTAVTIHILQVELYYAFLLASVAKYSFFLLFPADIWKNARQWFMLRRRWWHNSMYLRTWRAQILIKDVISWCILRSLNYLAVLIFYFLKACCALCIKMLVSRCRLTQLWHCLIHRLVYNLGKFFANDEFARYTGGSGYHIISCRCRIACPRGCHHLFTLLVFHDQFRTLRELLESLSFSNHWRIICCSIWSLLSFLWQKKLYV